MKNPQKANALCGLLCEHGRPTGYPIYPLDEILTQDV